MVTSRDPRLNSPAQFRRIALYDLGGLRYWLPRARTLRKNLRLRVDGRQILREVAHRTSLDTALVLQPSPEPAADRPSVDAALSRLAEVFPRAASAWAVRYWGGLVDMTPDGLPVIDAVSGPRGLRRHRALRARPPPRAGASDLALDGSTGLPIEPFSLARFTGKVAWPEVMI
jgi:glycine/D-amino acid oxidase-like deaminating enzyme